MNENYYQTPLQERRGKTIVLSSVGILSIWHEQRSALVSIRNDISNNGISNERRSLHIESYIQRSSSCIRF